MNLDHDRLADSSERGESTPLAECVPGLEEHVSNEDTLPPQNSRISNRLEM